MIRVLHVDDDKYESELIRAQIQRVTSDLAITWASSAKRALALLDTESFDCIVSDFQMPGMDGYEFLLKLREHDAHTPFIFYTGQGDERLAADAFRSGADDYYTKEKGFAHFERLTNSIIANANKARKLVSLKEVELEQNSFFQLTNGLLIVTKFDGEILRINSGWAETLGYSEEEMLGSKYLEFVHPDDKEKTIAVAEELFEEGFLEGFINRYRHKDGSYRFLKWSSRSLPEFEVTYSIAIDITELQETINKLEESENRYRALLENSPGPTFQFLVKPRNTFAIPYITESVYPLTGIRASEFRADPASAIEKSMGDTYHAFREDVINKCNEVRETWPRPSQERVAFDESYPITKDGQQRWIRINSIADLLSDGTILWEGFISDVTEQKSMQKELEISEEKYRMLIDGINEGISLVDGRENILFINRAGARIFGVPADELVGRNLSEFICEDDWPKVIESTQKTLRGKGERYEIRIDRADGEKRIIEVSSTSTTMGENGEINTMGAFQDITERRQNEENLQQLNKEMEAFTYSVSHDLKAPLRQMKGFAKILQDEYGDIITGDGRQCLDYLLDNAVSASRIIDDLLQFSRAQKTELKKEPTDISGLAESVFKTIRHHYPDSSTDISIQPSLEACCDASLMTRVIENLFSNALKYSAVKPRPAIALERVNESQKWQTFRVRDNGEGFDPEHARKMFDPFVRLHNGNHPGTGIGLSIVRRVIERHGGKVWARGRVGVGSEFYFTLPKEAE